MKYKIEILETIWTIVEVEADDLGDALDDVREQYDNGDIVLNSGIPDVGCDVEFTAQ